MSWTHIRLVVVTAIQGLIDAADEQLYKRDQDENKVSIIVQSAESLPLSYSIVFFRTKTNIECFWLSMNCCFGSGHGSSAVVGVVYCFYGNNHLKI